VSGDLVRRIVASVDRTYDAGTARFRWRMPAEGPWLGLSVGAVDFRTGRLAMRSRFALPGPSVGPPGHQAAHEDGSPQGSRAGNQNGSPQVVETHSVVADGVLYTLPGVDESPDSHEWIAIELGPDGLATTPVGLIAWARGATTAEATDPTGLAATVVLDLPLAIARAPTADQATLRHAWESARVGLSDATVPADVVLGRHGRLTRLRVTVPAGTSPWFAVAHQEDTMQLDLHGFGTPVSIPRPDPTRRFSVAEFLSAIAVPPDEAGWAPEPWPPRT
jgi:hypothetical protein